MLVAGSSAYTLTGQDATLTLTSGFILSTGSGSYALIGTARTRRSSPVQVEALTAWNELYSGGNHILATKAV